VGKRKSPLVKTKFQKSKAHGQKVDGQEEAIKKLPSPQPGPQEKFLNTEADIAIYGGAAYSGKSFALLLDFGRFIDESQYRAVIFRRTSPQITNEGGLFDTAGEVYQSVGAVPKQTTHEYEFPSGSTIRFAHLQHEKTKFDWQGSQLSRCVARGTLILMGDGTTKPVEDIKVGDCVATLQGSMPVTKTPPSEVKKAWRVWCDRASVVVSEDHKFLTDRGWVSLKEGLPIQSHVFCSNSVTARGSSRAIGQLSALRQLSRQQATELDEQTLHRKLHSDFCETQANVQISAGELYEIPLEASTPLKLTFRLALYEPAPQSEKSAGRHLTYADESSRACDGSEALNSQCDYRTYSHSCDGQPQKRKEHALRSIPLLDDAEKSSFCQTDDQYSARERILSDRYKYVHPYTMEIMEADQLGVCYEHTYAAPMGELELFDLRILQASHYITHDRIISLNCGYDELTHFTESQFFYLLSRVRSPSGIPTKIRATTNPDADSWVAKFISWWIDEEGNPIQERAGVLRWFIRLNENIEWADTWGDLAEKFSGQVAPEGDYSTKLIVPQSVTFVPGTLFDNALGVAADPTYLGKLQSLSAVERGRLLGGNWKISVSGGIVDRSWFKYYGTAPAHPTTIVQSWDTAQKENELADYSVCTTWAVTSNGYYLLDLYRQKVGSPDLIKAAINLGAKWKPNVVLVEDKGSGTGLIQHLRVSTTLSVFPINPIGAKMVRFSNESPAIEAGKVFLPEVAEWLLEYEQELSVAPNGKNDDQCDSTSQFLGYIREHGVKRGASLF
jgi:predicted phage terminase large subunit-like protein